MDCDLIVIGSGFGGSAVALRAAEAGLSVVVLERGPDLGDAGYEALRTGRRPFVYRPGNAGLFEPHLLSGLRALTANAVGGGSHIYTAVTTPPPPEVFENHWPATCSYESMAPYFQRVADVLNPTAHPDPPARTLAMDTIAGRMNAACRHLPLSLDWSNGEAVRASARGGRASDMRSDLVRWLRGGRAARKRTLDRNYLAQARAAGAEIRPLHEARTIEPSGDGYLVGFSRSTGDRNAIGLLHARRVVVAAGTLNTVRLLLHCRDRVRTLPRISDALGRRFFTNGDSGGALLMPRVPIGSDDGPPVTAWVDLWKTDKLFLMETGASPVFASLIRAGFGPWARLRSRMHSRFGDAAPYLWTFAVMGYDDSPGTLELDARGRLRHRPAQRHDAMFSSNRFARMRDFADAAGAILHGPSAGAARRMQATVHPLGGAGMADSPEQGVTNPFGEVHGYPGLYVADGSLACTPTGVPPSMTIAALGEHVAEHVIRSCQTTGA